MSKVLDRIGLKQRNIEKYDEMKKEFSKCLGRPVIILPLELPESLSYLRDEFCALEDDQKFLKRLNRLCARYLKKKHPEKVAPAKE